MNTVLAAPTENALDWPPLAEWLPPLMLVGVRSLDEGRAKPCPPCWTKPGSPWPPFSPTMAN